MKVIKLLFLGIIVQFNSFGQLVKTQVPVAKNVNGSDLFKSLGLAPNIGIEIIDSATVNLSGINTVSLTNLTSTDILTYLPSILDTDLSSLSALEINGLVQSIYDKVEEAKNKVFIDEPVSLRLSLEADSIEAVRVRIDKGEQHYDYKKVKILDAQVKFQDGAIKNLVISVMNNGKESTYINTCPIPVMTLQNLMKFWGKRVLVEQDGKPNDKSFVFLNDVLKIKPVLQQMSGSLAPKNQVVSFTSEEADWALPIRRNSRKSLFDARVYSDLLGLNTGLGNGLLQAQISKRIILNASPANLDSNYSVSNNEIKLKNAFLYWGHFITPMVSWNKLEGTDRFVDLAEENAFIVENKEAYSLDNLTMLNYASFQAGVEMNLAELVMPFGSIGVSPYFMFRQTPISFNSNLDQVNSVSPGIKLFGVIQPESFYEGELSLSFERFMGLGSKLITVPDKDVIQMGVPIGSQASYLFRACFDNTVRLSESTSLFARARFNFDLSSNNQNYYELQIGSSFDIPLSRK